MAKNRLPEKLNSDTPQWFKDWHCLSFWYFKSTTERTLAFQSKILWAIIVLLITVGITAATKLWLGF